MVAALQAAESKEEQREERTHQTPAWHWANPLPTPEVGVTRLESTQCGTKFFPPQDLGKLQSSGRSEIVFQELPKGKERRFSTDY